MKPIIEVTLEKGSNSLFTKWFKQENTLPEREISDHDQFPIKSIVLKLGKTVTLTSTTTSTVKRPVPTKKWPVMGPASNDNTTTDQPNCTTTTNIPIPDDDDDDTNHWEIAWMIGGIIGSIGTLAMIIKIMIELKEHYSCKGGKCRCDFCWRLGTCFWDCLKRNPNKKKESPRPIRNPIYTGPASSRRNRRIRSQQVQRTRATGVVGFSSSLSDCREGDTVLELRGDDENEVTSSDEDTNIDTLEPLRGPFDDIRDPFREPFTDDFWFTEDDTDEDKDRIEIAQEYIYEDNRDRFHLHFRQTEYILPYVFLILPLFDLHFRQTEYILPCDF